MKLMDAFLRESSRFNPLSHGKASPLLLAPSPTDPVSLPHSLNESPRC
jgi:hypothetical protein